MKSKFPRTIGELASLIGASVEGDGEGIIEGAAPIETAGPGEISFVANSKYEKLIAGTGASALVLGKSVDSHGRTAIRHDHPYLAFARILTSLYPPPAATPGINATAQIAESALIDPTASIGAYVVIGERSRVGAKVVIESHVTIGEDVSIGERTELCSGVRIGDRTIIGSECRIFSNAVIGADGFGYAESPTGLFKVPQIGHVEIGDRVEIGANATIDRGALGPTVIGSGSKIDNLVMIAHNVRIGQHCIIVAQSGISGSTRLGNGVVLGGQVGISGHIELGDGVRVGAQSGVSNSIPAGATYFGYPAREIMQAKRIEAVVSRLPELLRRIRALEEERGS